MWNNKNYSFVADTCIITSSIYLIKKLASTLQVILCLALPNTLLFLLTVSRLLCYTFWTDNHSASITWAATRIWCADDAFWFHSFFTSDSRCSSIAKRVTELQRLLLYRNAQNDPESLVTDPSFPNNQRFLDIQTECANRISQTLDCIVLRNTTLILAFWKYVVKYLSYRLFYKGT